MSIFIWFYIAPIIPILHYLSINYYDIIYFLFLISYFLGAGEELLGQSEKVDASGNRKLPAIGVRTHVPCTLTYHCSNMFLSLIR